VTPRHARRSADSHCGRQTRPGDQAHVLGMVGSGSAPSICQQLPCKVRLRVFQQQCTPGPWPGGDQLALLGYRLASPKTARLRRLLHRLIHTRSDRNQRYTAMKTTLALLALLAVAAVAGALTRKSPGDGCTPDACLMKQAGVSMTLFRRRSCLVLATSDRITA